MTFVRTPSGQSAYHLFSPEPIVWVEGDDDLVFFEGLLSGHSLKVKAAGDVEQCRNRAAELESGKGGEGAAVIDGDYWWAKGRARRNKKLVRLRRHAVENYLVDPETVASYVSGVARQRRETVKREFESLLTSAEEHIATLVAYDAVRACTDGDFEAVPKSVERLLTRGASRVGFSDDQMAAWVSKVGPKACPATLPKVISKLTAQRQRRPILHFLHGHLALGIARHFAERVARRRRSTRVSTDQAFAGLMAVALAKPLGRDHRRLRSEILRAVREQPPTQGPHSGTS